jgi:hypothetical protein
MKIESRDRVLQELFVESPSLRLLQTRLTESVRVTWTRR